VTCIVAVDPARVESLENLVSRSVVSLFLSFKIVRLCRVPLHFVVVLQVMCARRILDLTELLFLVVEHFYLDWHIQATSRQLLIHFHRVDGLVVKDG
jgi:hypothetical protein